jgi:L,D-peptidoglycan transpeptidase YkuD (ErfK/YbiS/YcfS/YnhG family)
VIDSASRRYDPAMILFAPLAVAGPLPAGTTQLVLVVAPTADDSRAVVTRWEREGDGWTAVGEPFPARIGAEGLAWGRGLHPPQPGRQKVEGDDRAPAGVFLLGDAWAYDPIAPSGGWPAHVVGSRDLWVEDPASPLYNTHVVVAGDRSLEPWEDAARMRLGDPAHALKVFVAHNAPPDAVPGAGSAIFLHTWRRDGDRPTAGCTAMARSDLDALVGWLSPAATPVLVLLSAADLERLAAAWDLPH